MVQRALLGFHDWYFKSFMSCDDNLLDSLAMLENVGTIVCGHKRVWAQTCLGTNVSGHKRVWTQSCVGTIVWAQSCMGPIVVEPFQCIHWTWKLCLHKASVKNIHNCQRSSMGFSTPYVQLIEKTFQLLNHWS